MFEKLYGGGGKNFSWLTLYIIISRRESRYIAVASEWATERNNHTDK